MSSIVYVTVTVLAVVDYLKYVVSATFEFSQSCKPFAQNSLCAV